MHANPKISREFLCQASFMSISEVQQNAGCHQPFNVDPQEHFVCFHSSVPEVLASSHDAPALVHAPSCCFMPVVSFTITGQPRSFICHELVRPKLTMQHVPYINFSRDITTSQVVEGETWCNCCIDAHGTLLPI